MTGQLTFSCTQCGRCCRDTNIPLTLDEAIAWLEEKGEVAIYCEADPWPNEPPESDLRTAHRKRRSFAARCGSSSLRITSILVAKMSGACMNLDDDMLCRIYDRRPLVCRIYPAEISPLIQLNVEDKLCPPEAWGRGDATNGATMDTFHSLVEQSRQTDQDDAPRKSLLCSELNINVTALAGEGFIAHAPAPARLLEVLRKVRGATTAAAPVSNSWCLYSPLEETMVSMASKGFQINSDLPAAEYSFLRSA